MTRRDESVRATLHEGGLVRIRTIRMVRGVDVGGSLWLAAEAVPWLADALSPCIEDQISSEIEIGPDAQRVRVKRHELDAMVGIGNVRTGAVEHAGRYFAVMREGLARAQTGQLRDLGERAD